MNNQTLIAPPDSIAQLMQRSQALAGLTIAQAAQQANMAMPDNLQRKKGWVGQLLEALLGASAGQQALPDFPDLAIELKTIPIDKQGAPLETTYVCTAPMRNDGYNTWENAWLRQKLSHVLWFPIEGCRSIPLAERRFGTGFLWQPSNEQENLLRQDWEELTDMILMGDVANISARFGEVLQLRPKAGNSHARCTSNNAAGEPTLTLPRGFYLRKSFTGEILRNFQEN